MSVGTLSRRRPATQTQWKRDAIGDIGGEAQNVRTVGDNSHPLF